MTTIVPVSSVKIHTLSETDCTTQLTINQIHLLSTLEEFTARQEGDEVKILGVSQSGKDFTFKDTHCDVIRNVKFCGWLQNSVMTNGSVEPTDMLFCVNNDVLQLFLFSKVNQKRENVLQHVTSAKSVKSYTSINQLNGSAAVFDFNTLVSSKESFQSSIVTSTISFHLDSSSYEILQCTIPLSELCKHYISSLINSNELSEWKITHCISEQRSSLFLIFEAVHLCELQFVNSQIKLGSVFTMNISQKSTRVKGLISTPTEEEPTHEDSSDIVDEYISFASCSDRYIFALCKHSNNMIDVWDVILQSKVGLIDLFNVVQLPSTIGNRIDANFSEIQVTPDGLKLTVFDSKRSQIHVIDLDKYFVTVVQQKGIISAAQTFVDDSSSGSDSGSEESGSESDEDTDTQSAEESSEQSSMDIVNLDNKSLKSLVASRSLLCHWYDEIHGNPREHLLAQNEANNNSLISTRNRQCFKEDNGFRRESRMTGDWDIMSQLEQTFNRSNSTVSSENRDQINSSLRVVKDNGIISATLDYTIIRPCYIQVDNSIAILKYYLTNQFLYVLFQQDANYTENERQSQVYLYVLSISTNTCGILPLTTQQALILCSRRTAVMLVDSHSLSQIVFGQTHEEILDRVITVKDAHAALELCNLNGWDERALKIHVLELSLRDREIPSIEDALNHIEPEQEVFACCVILKFVSDTSFAKSSDFKEKTLLLTINFISKLIEERVGLLGDEVQRSDESKPQYKLVTGFNNNLGESLSKLLEMYRAFRQSDDELLFTVSEEILLLTNILIALRTFLLSNEKSADMESQLTSIRVDNSKGKTPKQSEFTSLSFLNTSKLDESDIYSEYDPFSSSVNVDDPYNYNEEYISDSDSDIWNDAESEEDIPETIQSYEHMFYEQYPEVYNRWKYVGERAIMIEALQTGSIPLAYSYLKYRYFRSHIADEMVIYSPEHDVNSDNDDLAGEAQDAYYSDISSFEQFKSKAYSLVYEFFANNQFDTGIRMLRNLGEEVLVHMKEIAFNTLDSNLRNQLLRELERKGCLTKEELTLVELMHRIESAYPETSFMKILRSSNPNVSDSAKKNDSLFVSGDINDLGEYVQLETDTADLISMGSETSLQPDAIEEEVIENKIADVQEEEDLVVSRKKKSRSKPKKTSKKRPKQPLVSKSKREAYFVGTLEWLKSWSEQTKQRVLIERNEELIGSSIEAKLQYYIAQHDVLGVIRWVNSLPLRADVGLSVEVLDNGLNVGFTASSSRPEAQEVVKFYTLVIDVLNKQLKRCPPVFKEILLHALSLRGILSKDAVRNFSRLSKRLAKSSQIFKSSPSRYSLDIVSSVVKTDKNAPVLSTSIHPEGTMSRFHEEFINFCIQNDLSFVLERYMDKFNLWNAAMEQMKLEKNPKTWLSMLLMAQKKDIFTLSLLNAQQYLKQSEKEGISLNRVLASNKPLIALATLMYSPVSLDESLNSSLSSIYYISSRRLATVINPYPSFHRALLREAQCDAEFISSRKTILSEDEQSEEKIQLADMECSRGNIVTVENDISLFEMLKETHYDISLEDLLPAPKIRAQSHIDPSLDEHNSYDSYKLDYTDTLLTCSSESLAPYRFIDTLDMEYYLKNNRPMEAYKLLLSRFEGSLEPDEFALLYSPYMFSFEEQADIGIGVKEDVEKNLIDTNLTSSEISDLCLRVRDISIANFEDLSISSSCKTYLDLCAADECKRFGRMIKIEGKAARRIMNHHPDFIDNLEARDGLIKLFRSTTSMMQINDDRTSEREIARLLEQATQEMLKVESQTRKEAGVSVQMLYGQSSLGQSLYTSPWKLVFELYRTYGLGMYMGHLVQLAQQDQWLALFYEAEDLKIPVNEVLRIVMDHAQPSALKQHMVIVLRSMTESDGANNDLVSFDNREKSTTLSQIFYELLYCNDQYQSSPSLAFTHLIAKAQEHSQPLLALIAVSYMPDKTLVALLTWIRAYSCRFTELEKIPEITISSSTNQLVQMLEKMLKQLCAFDFVKSYPDVLHFIVQTLQIFDSDSPLINFYSFYSDILSRKFSSAQRHLFSFVTAVSSDDTNGCLVSNEWMMNVGTYHTKHLIEKITISYEISQVLRILYECRFYGDNNEFGNLYHLDLILNNLKNEALLDESNAHSHYESLCMIDIVQDKPESIVKELSNLGYYNEARDIAVTFKISESSKVSPLEITKLQAISYISKLKESALWKFERERRALWLQIEHLFTLCDFDKFEGGKFFLGEAIKLDDKLAVGEIIALLEIAGKWFNQSKTAKHQEKQTLSSRDSEFLQTNIALLRNSTVSIGHSQRAFVTSILQSLSRRILYSSSDSDKGLAEFRPMPEFCDNVIDSLLLKGKLSEAEALAQHFSHQNADLIVIRAALDVARANLHNASAQKTHSLVPSKILSPTLYNGIKEFIPNLDEIRDLEVIFDKLHLLCYGHRGARYFCKIIALNFSIGRLLGISYDEVVEKDDYEILRHLLTCGHDKLKLCSTFMLLRELDLERSGAVCAQYLFTTFCDYYEDETPTIINNDLFTSALIEDYFNNDEKEDLDKAETLSSSSSTTSRSTTSSVITTDSSASFRTRDMLKPKRTVGQNQKNDSRYDIVKCDRDEFLEYASICKDPSSLATHLLDLTDKSLNGVATDTLQDEQEDSSLKVTLKCQVELTIRAYWCYQVASSLEGIENLLKRIKSQLVNVLVDKKEFSLIVRLLLSTRNFTELGYLFDVLMKHEQFELILRRNPDKSIQNELKTVLASYLKEKFPEDDEKLMMVYLRFNMFKEYGSLLMKKGLSAIAIAHEKLTGGPPSPRKITEYSDVPIEDLLTKIADNLSSAAESFTSEDCFHTASKCIAMCNLVELQNIILKNSKKKNAIFSVLNMTVPQVRQFMKTHPIFAQALIVAQAYEVNQMSEWVEPIYYQCIVQGNLAYFLQLRLYLPTSSNLFREISKKFMNEASLTPKMSLCMAKFCTMCSDYSVRLEILKQLGQLNSEVARNAAAILDAPLVDPVVKSTRVTDEEEESMPEDPNE